MSAILRSVQGSEEIGVASAFGSRDFDFSDSCKDENIAKDIQYNSFEFFKEGHFNYIPPLVKKGTTVEKGEPASKKCYSIFSCLFPKKRKVVNLVEEELKPIDKALIESRMKEWLDEHLAFSMDESIERISHNI